MGCAGGFPVYPAGSKVGEIRWTELKLVDRRRYVVWGKGDCEVANHADSF